MPASLGFDLVQADYTVSSGHRIGAVQTMCAQEQGLVWRHGALFSAVG